ncbi:MAG: EAL domain-containing protein [Lachnospiraceae bacterium]|nr:EAL domain-containing protein [Lachnospiraceae bacterium]
MESKIENLEQLDLDALVKYFPDIFNSFSHTADGKYVFINNLQEDYSIWSKEAVEFFGLPSMEMKNAGEIWLEHVAPEDKKRYMDDVTALFNGEKDVHDMYYRAMSKDGEYVTCSCKGMIIRDDDGKPKYFAGTIVNHEKEDTIDPVTGLYSHQSLLRQMATFSHDNRKYFLTFLGIQRFANINATYGYEMGNRILKEFASHLMQNKQHCMIFRLEGTKFAILSEAEMVGVVQADTKFNRVHDYAKNEIEIDGIRIPVDICGSGMYVEKPSMDINTVYNSVLYALDIAKKENRQTLLAVDEDFFSQNEKRLLLLAKIRNSIHPSIKGFFLTYQPIVDSKTEEIKGVEALLRWKDETGCVIPPDVYIEWLELDPLFYELGNWILKTAMTDMLPFVQEQSDFIVNVNLAYPQLQRTDFNENLVRILQECQFPAKNLKLELTERCRVLDKEQLKNSVAFFKSLGICTALDDFGTGYSALTLMVNLPVDQIKIDRSYVHDIETNKEKQVLIHAVTECANGLGKQICVEGVETEGAADYIRKNFSTTYFQGYYYAKPLELADFIEFYESKKK